MIKGESASYHFPISSFEALSINNGYKPPLLSVLNSLYALTAFLGSSFVLSEYDISSFCSGPLPFSFEAAELFMMSAIISTTSFSIPSISKKSASSLISANIELIASINSFMKSNIFCARDLLFSASAFANLGSFNICHTLSAITSSNASASVNVWFTSLYALILSCIISSNVSGLSLSIVFFTKSSSLAASFGNVAFK